MRPLLWKEYRELRVTLLVWLAGLAVVQVWRWIPSRTTVPDEVLVRLFPAVGILAAVALGSELLTRERHSRTTDYLLARPVSGEQIVWAKFIAGSIMLLLFVAASLALALSSSRQTSDVRLVQMARQAPFLASLVTVYSRLWFIMAFTLAVSALVGTRGKAVTAVLLAVAAGVGISRAVSQWQPWLDADIWALGALGSDAHSLVTGSPALLFMVAGVWCGLAVAAAALAAVLFARWPSLSPGWLLVGVVSVGYAILLPNALLRVKPAVPAMQPAAVYRLASGAGPLLAADGSLVCVVGGGRFLAVDFSDPARPRQLTEANFPLWTFSSVEVQGTRVMLAGIRKGVPADTAGVLVFDMASPETHLVASLGAAGARDWIGSTELVGGYLYAGAGSMWGAALRVFDLASGTTARETAVIDIEKPREPSIRFAGPLQFGMCVRGNFAYLASTGTLTTLDVSDPAHPRVVGRTELAPANLIAYGMPQQVAIADGRLYVEGVSPSRLLSFDLADPARPSLSELYTWQLRNGSLLGTTRGSLYVCLPQTDGALVFAPKPGLWPGRMRQITGSGVRLPARVAFGDHLYVLAGGRLAAYDVAGGV